MTDKVRNGRIIVVSEPVFVDFLWTDFSNQFDQFMYQQTMHFCNHPSAVCAMQIMSGILPGIQADINTNASANRCQILGNRQAHREAWANEVCFRG